MSGPAATAFKFAALAAAAVFVVTAALGVVIGLRVTQPRALAVALLALGVALPGPLAWYALAAAPRPPPAETAPATAR